MKQLFYYHTSEKREENGRILYLFKLWEGGRDVSKNSEAYVKKSYKKWHGFFLNGHVETCFDLIQMKTSDGILV